MMGDKYGGQWLVLFEVITKSLTYATKVFILYDYLLAEFGGKPEEASLQKFASIITTRSIKYRSFMEPD